MSSFTFDSALEFLNDNGASMSTQNIIDLALNINH